MLRNFFSRELSFTAVLFLSLYGTGKASMFVERIIWRLLKFLHFVWFQNGSEMLKTVSNVSKVYDEVEKEQARLYNPFIITLAKTPVQLVYPYYYRGVSSKITHKWIKLPANEGRGGEGVRWAVFATEVFQVARRTVHLEFSPPEQLSDFHFEEPAFIPS